MNMMYGEKISRIWNGLLLLLFLVCINIGCLSSNEESIECVNDLNQNFSEDSLLNDFLFHKSIWACNEVSHYRMLIEIQTQLCSGVIFDIEVKNNEGIESSVSSASFEYLLPFCTVYCVDSLFSLINIAIDESLPLPNDLKNSNNMESNVAYSTSVIYNDQFGYPEMGYIDYIFGIADEEFGFKVFEFEIFK